MKSSELDDEEEFCFSDVQGLTESDVGRYASGVMPLNHQQAVDAEAKSWGSIWQQGNLTKGPGWPADLGDRLPSPSVERFRVLRVPHQCRPRVG